MKLSSKKKNKSFNKKYPMYDWCRDLFNICRSITGKGIKKTLSYFEKINPELKRIKFKSGTKVFDWRIPKEWNIYDAYLEHENGKRFAEFKKNNLHVVNFSTKVNKVLYKKDLLKYIYTNKNLPNAIPYVTSYYKKNWGFCMRYMDLKKLPEGKYKAVIKSEIKSGNLDISHALIKGKTKIAEQQ